MSSTETSLPTTLRQNPLVENFSIGVASLLIANGGVLVLFFLYDVTLFQLVLVYWCECAWIGIFSGVKLILASIFGSPYENRWVDFSPGASVFTSLLVIGTASGGFFSLLGLMLISILFANDNLALSNPGDDTYNHIGLVVGVSLLLMGSHALSLIINFLILGEFRVARVGSLIALAFQTPCLALFLAIIMSIAFVALTPSIASTAVFAIAVVLVKILLDLRLHLSERREFASSIVGTNVSQ